MTRPEAFYYPNLTYTEARDSRHNYGACLDQAPLMKFLRNDLNQAPSGNNSEPCLSNDIHDHDDLQRQIITFVRSLYWNDRDGYDG